MSAPLQRKLWLLCPLSLRSAQLCYYVQSRARIGIRLNVDLMYCSEAVTNCCKWLQNYEAYSLYCAMTGWYHVQWLKWHRTQGNAVSPPPFSGRRRRFCTSNIPKTHRMVRRKFYYVRVPRPSTGDPSLNVPFFTAIFPLNCWVFEWDL